MAISSTSEVEHHLTVCADLRLINGAIVQRLAARSVEIRKMLFGFRRALLEAEDEEEKEKHDLPPGPQPVDLQIELGQPRSEA